MASLTHQSNADEYDYDVMIVRASSGTVIEEAMGWDRSLPPRPQEKAVPGAQGNDQASTACGPARRASLTALTPDGQVAWRTALPHPDDIGTTRPLVVGGTALTLSSVAGVTEVGALP